MEGVPRVNWSLLGQRADTMRYALEHALDAPAIVETGCYRGKPNEGMSTVLFATWVAEHGGSLHSVDIDPEAVAEARLFAPGATIVASDSVAFLAALTGPIDLLYLDSHDYPDGALRDLYGGREDIHAAMAFLSEMGDEWVVANHGDLILPSQQHAAAEVTAALPLLHSRSIVVIDDAALPGGGKARLAREVLGGAGFRCVMDGYQTVWTR